MNVPFVDLYAQYLSIKDEIDAALGGVIANSAFIRGPHVDAFERAWAATLGMSHCVSCANGTDALHITMRALGIKPGDEVITTAQSWISTSAMITQTGGRVVFCDVDPVTFTIDSAQIESRITSRTVGIIPVHLYGQPANMDGVMAIAHRHSLWVIEDCAQAHLARFKGRLVGTFGNAATFSFYPGKNLGAYGDAGCIVTNDDRMADWMAPATAGRANMSWKRSTAGWMAFRRRSSTPSFLTCRGGLRLAAVWRQTTIDTLAESETSTPRRSARTATTCITSTSFAQQGGTRCRPIWEKPESPPC